MDSHAAALLAGPLTVGFAALGPSIAIGMMTSSYFNSVARQPEVQGSLSTFYFITLGVVELLGLFGFLTFVLLGFGIVK